MAKNSNTDFDSEWIDPVSSAAWGDIGGDISEQLDLISLLDNYQPLSTILSDTTASFTTTLESKIDGIEAGAQVNVNADWNSTSGDSEIFNKPDLSIYIPFFGAASNVDLSGVTTTLGFTFASGLLINESNPWDNGVSFEAFGKGGFWTSAGKYAYFADSSYAGYFSDSSNSVYICDGSYSLNVIGNAYFSNQITCGGIFSSDSAIPNIYGSTGSGSSLGLFNGYPSNTSIILGTSEVSISGAVILSNAIDQGSGAPGSILTSYRLYVDTATGLIYCQ